MPQSYSTDWYDWSDDGDWGPNRLYHNSQTDDYRLLHPCGHVVEIDGRIFHEIPFSSEIRSMCKEFSWMECAKCKPKEPTPGTYGAIERSTKPWNPWKKNW
jgi:hypothetical protein